MSFKDTPIICSPYDAPAHHYALSDDGQPTGEKLEGRRASTYLVPVPLPFDASPHRLNTAAQELQVEPGQRLGNYRAISQGEGSAETDK